MVAVSQTGGRELGETGRMRRGEKREGSWEEGSKMSSDVSWAREDAAKVKVSEKFETEPPSKSFFIPRAKQPSWRKSVSFLHIFRHGRLEEPSTNAL